SAAGTGGTGKAGLLTGPDDHAATLATGPGIGGDPRLATDRGALGRLDVPPPLEVSADRRLAATCVAGDVDRRRAEQPDLLAGDADFAARRSGRGTGCVEGSCDLDDTPIAARQHDLAAHGLDRTGLDDAVHVDDAV